MDHGNPTIDDADVLFCSDEHVTFTPQRRRLRVGDRVLVWPSHVDPTVAYHERMHLADGPGLERRRRRRVGRRSPRLGRAADEPVSSRFQRRARATTLSPTATVANTPTPTTTNITASTTTVSRSRARAAPSRRPRCGAVTDVPAVEPDDSDRGTSRARTARARRGSPARRAGRATVRCRYRRNSCSENAYDASPSANKHGVGRDHEVRPRRRSARSGCRGSCARRR